VDIGERDNSCNIHHTPVGHPLAHSGVVSVNFWCSLPRAGRRDTRYIHCIAQWGIYVFAHATAYRKPTIISHSY